MAISVVNVREKFSRFSDYANPRVVSEVNDCAVKLVKLKGEFMWHHHDEEDELFFVTQGRLRMRVRDEGGEKEFYVGPGEFITIPRGTEHFPSADEEVHIILIEPKTTLNTGNLVNERTRAELERI